MATSACPSHLTYVRDSNCEIFSPNQFAAPAETIQAFADGAIGACLPSRNCRVEAYAALLSGRGAARQPHAVLAPATARARELRRRRSPRTLAMLCVFRLLSRTHPLVQLARS